jgi:hypothetical protein
MVYPLVGYGTPIAHLIGVPVEIGSSYFINILNLTATRNAFRFDMSPT